MADHVIGLERCKDYFPGLQAFKPVPGGEFPFGAVLQGFVKAREFSAAVLECAAVLDAGVRDGDGDGGAGKIRQHLREFGGLVRGALEGGQPACGGFTGKGCAVQNDAVLGKLRHTPGAPAGEVLHKGRLLADPRRRIHLQEFAGVGMVQEHHRRAFNRSGKLVQVLDVQYGRTVLDMAGR